MDRAFSFEHGPSSTPPSSASMGSREHRGRKRERALSRGSPASDIDSHDHESVFGNAKRRQKFASSEGHLEMVKICRRLIVARVLSGDGSLTRGGGRRCDVWAGANAGLESELVRLVWEQVLEDREKFELSTALKIHSSPYPAEARKVG